MRYWVEQTLIDLLSEDPWARLAAAASVDPAATASRYALRAALLGDPDGRVRAQAAMTLGRGPARPEVDGWLGEGLLDALPSVREACLRALGHHRAQGAAPACARLSTEDPVWWVRRSALLALALSAEVAAIPTLRQTLGDPFWRVRHAAVQALGALGDAHPAERARILSQDEPCRPVAAAALWYLRARFDPSIEVHKFRLPERQDEPLWNADPAVTTARLRARPAAGELDELVALLGDPHQPLRELAAQRLLAHAGVPTLRGALRHLEVPGLPHALATTWALLDGLGERARELAAEVLADREAPPGALGWAASWVVRARCEELLAALAAQAQHIDPRARTAVAQALAQASPPDLATLALLLEDDDPGVRDAAALGLCQSRDEAAARALHGHAATGFTTAVRAALVVRAARVADRAALAAAATDPHPGPRAQALAALAYLGVVSDAEAALADPDPWVRAAVLRAVPAAWLPTLTADPEPAVRRHALQLALAARQTLAEPARSQLARAAASSLDPWLRARGCDLFSLRLDAELQAVLRLSRDAEPMVRAAAAARLAALPDGDQRLRQLLAQPGWLSAEERAAAYARLLREPDEAAVALLAAGLGKEQGSPAEPSVVRKQLRATALLLSDDLRQSLQQSLPESERRALADLETPAAPLRRPAVRPAMPEPPRRPLGRTGLLVSPLALSGAHELTGGALAQARQAGVNLFFTNGSYAN